MEENNENVVEEIQPQESSTDDNVVKVDVSDNAPVIDEDGVIKVDLRKPPPSEQPQEEQVEDVVEEITEEPVAEVTEPVEAPVAPEQPVELPTLPENIQKLVDFMEETGGDLNDYVQLNQNYDELDNLTALETYYKKTKPHLSDEEVQFMMDDQFSYNEELDEERDIKRKKLAMKEQVAEAKSYLDSLKSKYYEEIKAGGKLTDEQREAIEFFNKYNEELEVEEDEDSSEPDAHRIAHIIESIIRFGNTSALCMVFSPKGKEGKITTHLLDPGVLSGPLFARTAGSILMSGTLYPPEMYADILALPKNLTTPMVVG